MPDRSCGPLIPHDVTAAELAEVELIAELPDREGYLNVGRQTADGSREVYFACQDFRKPSKVLYQFQAHYAGTIDLEYALYKDKYWQTFERFSS